MFGASGVVGSEDGGVVDGCECADIVKGMRVEVPTMNTALTSKCRNITHAFACFVPTEF
jgi:hypothetical protein